MASTGIPKIFNADVTIEPYEILQKLGEDLEGEEKSLEEMKRDINISLLESNKKIIVFIDDIDRLDKDEIFTLFKLIKINADFKNLVFIVCMDHDHVAESIHSRYWLFRSDGAIACIRFALKKQHAFYPPSNYSHSTVHRSI